MTLYRLEQMPQPLQKEALEAQEVLGQRSTRDNESESEDEDTITVLSR